MSVERDRIRQAIDRAAANGARAALRVLAQASAVRAPRATGALIASQRIEMAADGKTGAVSYGVPYAALRHERGSKYLEQPARDAAVTAWMAETVADAFRKELR